MLKLNLQFFAWTDIRGSESTEQNENKVNFFQLKKTGDSATIRILDGEPYSRWTHWVNSVQRSFTCAGRNCPICEIIKQEKANGITGNDRTQTSAKKHALKIWNYTTERIEILDQGKEFMDTILGYVEDEEYGDPRKYDLKITRKGTGKDTSYSIVPRPKAKLSAEIEKAYKEDETDFKEYFKAPTSAQILAVLAGKSLEDAFAVDETTDGVPFDQPENAEVDFTVED